MLKKVSNVWQMGILGVRFFFVGAGVRGYVGARYVLSAIDRSAQSYSRTHVPTYPRTLEKTNSRTLEKKRPHQRVSENFRLSPKSWVVVG